MFQLKGTGSSAVYVRGTTSLGAGPFCSPYRGNLKSQRLRPTDNWCGPTNTGKETMRGHSPLAALADSAAGISRRAAERRAVRLAYQTRASSTFLSDQISINHQPRISEKGFSSTGLLSTSFGLRANKRAQATALWSSFRRRCSD
jgi:hypothetical protein